MITRILLFANEGSDTKVAKQCREAGFEVELLTYEQIKGHVPAGQHICFFLIQKIP